MLKIGALKLKSNLILAPMSGITDLPFRMLNRKFGCAFAFTEMLNVRSVSYKSKRLKEMLAFDQKDTPLGIQILGCEPNYILKALEVLHKYKFDLLDFNAACPAKKVARRGEGASLLKEPKKLCGLLKLIVKNSAVPVTVKIRSGWDDNSLNAREVSLLAQDAGVSAVFIHGRTKMQGYSGTVDYLTIGKIKKELKIPVIASGNIFNAQLAKKMLDETGCDGLLIARGALGNPWIFKEIKEYLAKGKITERPKISRIAQIMIRHLHSYTEFYGERNAVIKFRKFFSWYTKSLRNIRHLREKASLTKAEAGMVLVVRKIIDRVF